MGSVLCFVDFDCNFYSHQKVMMFCSASCFRQIGRGKSSKQGKSRMVGGGGTHLSLHLGGGEVLCQWPHWISCKTFIVLSFANLTFHKANKFSPYEYLWVHHPGIESWIPNVSKQSIKTPLEIFAYVNKIAEFKIGKTNGQQICFYR